MIGFCDQANMPVGMRLRFAMNTYAVEAHVKSTVE